MAVRTGDRVHQETYGAGGIIELNREYVTIAFDDGITRKFVASRVRLRPSDTPPPSRSTAGPRSKVKRGPSVGRGLAKGAAS